VTKTESWGKRLQSALKERGITQKDAAKLSGVRPSVVAGWISGASPNNFLAVKKLADHLGISFSWLMTGLPDKSEPMSSISEMFEEQEYFDGYARIRIDRLVPRKKKAGGS